MVRFDQDRDTPLGHENEDLSATDSQDLEGADQGHDPAADQDTDAGQESDTGNEADAKPAKSSDAGKKDERQSLLDVVTTAAEKARAGATSGAEGKTETGKPAAKDAATPEGTGDKAEGEQGKDKLPPFHEHPRWKELVAERDTLKGDAQQYHKITSFMEKHELAPDELAEGMVIMGMLKLEPEKGLARMKEHVARIEELLGMSLPPDLAEKVHDGAVTEEVAKETAQLRRRSEAATHEATRLTESRNQDQARARVVALNTEIKGAVDTWEASARKTDADFSKKAEWIFSEVRALQQVQGRPRTAEEAVKLTQTAYENVTKRLTATLPKPPATRRTPPTNSAVSSTPAAAPKSLLDVVTRAANQSA